MCYITTRAFRRHLRYSVSIRLLWKAIVKVDSSRLLDWQDYRPNPLPVDFFVQYVKSLVCASAIFLAFGNTASAAERTYIGGKLIDNMPSPAAVQRLAAILPTGAIHTLTQFRHPDPELLSTIGTSNNLLRLRGSWQKVIVPRASNISHRSAT